MYGRNETIDVDFAKKAVGHDRVSLDGCTLEEAGAALLASSVPRILMFACTVSRDALKALCSGSLTKLRCNMSDLETEDAQILTNNTSITKMDVMENKLGVEGVKLLCRNTTIRSLNIGWNEIGDVGANALALTTTLTQLHTAHNNIGHLGATSLAYNTTIETLTISGNHIGRGMKTLGLNTSITSLSLGPECLEELVNNTTVTRLELHLVPRSTICLAPLARNTTITSFSYHGPSLLTIPESFAESTSLLEISGNVDYIDCVWQRIRQNRLKITQIVQKITLLAMMYANKRKRSKINVHL